MKKILFATLLAITLMAAECNPDPVLNVQVTEITIINPGTMEIGQTATLKVDILPANATNQNVTWSVDNESTATVSSTGIVTAIGKGSTLIRATAVDESGVTNFCEVVVLFSAEGEGTLADPYVITVPAQLNAINSNLDAHYELGGDIDLTSFVATGSGVSTKGGAEGWLPIGDITNPFTGSLDGNGFKITGLTINRPTISYVGLFGFINGASISNLQLEDVDIIGGNGAVGGMVGGADYSSISNCYVTGVVNGTNDVGGVAGNAWFSSSITNCFAIGEVNGQARVGGVVGDAEFSSNISNCYAICVVNGSTTVGGVVGSLGNGNITYCYASGKVSGTAGIGGIVGGLGTSGDISYCVALNQSVSCSSNTTYVGRVAGNITSGTLTNNWAQASMVVTYDNGTDKTLVKDGDKPDGADCDAIPDPSWWASTPPSGPDWYGVNLWIFATGQLPKLYWQ